MKSDIDYYELLKFLSSVPLFAGLAHDHLEQLAGASQVRTFSKGASIFLQGDPAEALYVVHRGSVSTLFYNPDGRELIVDEVQAGRYFGELGLITGEPRSMNAVARDDCDLLVIPRTAFKKLLAREPLLTHNLLIATAKQLYRSNQRERALAFLDAPGRLARLLLQLDQQASDTGYITVSQDELASRTGLIRQTVAKSLGRWRRMGWLLTGRGKIVLLNKEALELVETQAGE